MTILNKEFLVKQIKEIRYDKACYDGEKPSPINSWNELHDICVTKVSIPGLCDIESHDIAYGEMLAIINEDWEEIADEVNDFIDEECQSYYLDPAFSSAADYYSYRFG